MPTKISKKRIEELVEEWRWYTGLSHWTIDIEIDEEKHVATSSVDFDYEEMTVFFNLYRLRQHEKPSPSRFSFLVLHELCHAHVWPLAQAAKEVLGPKHADWLEETVTNRIARAIWRSRYGKEPPQRPSKR